MMLIVDEDFNRLSTILDSYTDYKVYHEICGDSIFKDQKEDIVFIFPSRDIGIFVKFLGDIFLYKKSFNTILKISDFPLNHITRCTIFNKDGTYIIIDVMF